MELSIFYSSIGNMSPTVCDSECIWCIHRSVSDDLTGGKLVAGMVEVSKSDHVSRPSFSENLVSSRKNAKNEGST